MDFIGVNCDVGTVTVSDVVLVLVIMVGVVEDNTLVLEVSAIEVENSVVVDVDSVNEDNSLVLEVSAIEEGDTEDVSDDNVTVEETTTVIVTSDESQTIT